MRDTQPSTTRMTSYLAKDGQILLKAFLRISDRFQWNVELCRRAARHLHDFDAFVNSVCHCYGIKHSFESAFSKLFAWVLFFCEYALPLRLYHSFDSIQEEEAESLTKENQKNFITVPEPSICDHHESVALEPVQDSSSSLQEELPRRYALPSTEGLHKIMRSFDDNQKAV